MAKDNDAYVRAVSSSSHSLSSSTSTSDADDPSEEDVAAFDRVFTQFDPNGLGVVSMRDFLSMLESVFVIVFTKLAYDWLERREKSTQRDKKP